MSRQAITISDGDMAYAETVLLPKGQSFDEERRRFIRNLETIDLQAVPGSGKTTVLLAKLLILAKHLPFKDESAILVLSHTNAAVDRISRHVGTHCPRLFAYPNFLGTIQAFVDRFLAVPYYEGKYKRPVHCIDDELYNQNHFVPREARAWLSNRPDKDAVLYRSRLLAEDRLGFTLSSNGDDFPVGPNTQTYEALLRMKKSLRDAGLLCFDDAYILGFEYLTKWPQIRDILQQRFAYVFVDEMQDMDEEQYEILEATFHDKRRSALVYQRIGDKNQAIYSQEVSLDAVWGDRETVLRLKGSHRLPPAIAKAVTPFAALPIQVDGRNVANIDGTTNDISPHVIVFDDGSEARVIPKFCELVKRFKDAGRMPDSLKYPIKAIAWRKGDDGRFGLKVYWSGYEAEAVRSKTHHTCLKSYLSFAHQDNWHADGLSPIYRKIMDGLLGVLRREGVADPNGKAGYINEKGLLKYLRETETHTNLHDELRMKLFHWSRDIYLGRPDAVYSDLKAFIPKLLQVFGRRLNRANHFVNDDLPGESSANASVLAPVKPKDNVYRCPTTGIEVYVGTVHSAKGETHTATLYLESYYYNDGGKSYESQRLLDQFGGKSVATTAGKRVKQSARMVYVGFSRPTHLLCFAVHKNRFDEATFRKNGWEVVYAFEHVSTSGK